MQVQEAMGTSGSILLRLTSRLAVKGSPDATCCDGVIELPLTFFSGQTLAQAIYLSGLVRPPVLCSGLARCGRCRIKVLEPTGDRGLAILPAEESVFSPEMLAQGWRLACRHIPTEGMLIELPPDAEFLEVNTAETILFSSPQGHSPKSPQQATGIPEQMLAIDLGTTSLQWRHIAVEPDADASSGGMREALLVAEGGEVNPQMGAGSDVISRLAAAQEPSGRERLQRLTIASLRGLVKRAAERAAPGAMAEITAVCLAANPAMTALSLGKDTRGLAFAPYSLPVSGGAWEFLPGLPPVWIPPQLSPFVGGDISAGYAFLALNPHRPQPRYPFLLADLGTNGEFLLALSPDTAWSASVALGPALEGTGLSQGTEARPGAVAGFSLSPAGLVPTLLSESGRSVSGKVKTSPGITGTGYIALVHILLTVGILSREGRFASGIVGPLKRFFRLERDAASGEPYLVLPLGLRLHASDVEAILKVKAAFSLGLQLLLEEAGVATQELTQIYLAGALGEHVDKHALESLGFFPEGMMPRVMPVGNASLHGAELLLRSPSARDALVTWAEQVRSLDLAANERFVLGFAEQMRFSW